MRKSLVAIAICCLIAPLVMLGPSEAKKGKKADVDGKQVFEQHCASCHVGGGNRVKPSSPLAESKQLASIITFKSYLSAPPGHMPYYQQLVKDPKALQALYNYCRTLKKQPVEAAMAGGYASATN